MVDFKTLDAYITEHMEASNYNIVSALSTALSVSPKKAKELYGDMDLLQTTELVTTLSDESLSNEEQAAKTRAMFDDESLWEDDVFGGVDIAHGYDYRCIINDSASRDVYMDWLEENGLEYLINTGGHFAVRCPDREQTYRAQVAADGCKEKVWLKPGRLMAVDPDAKRTGFQDPKSQALNDSDFGVDHDTMNSFKGDPASMSPFSADTTPDEDEELADIDAEYSVDEAKLTKRQKKKKDDARATQATKQAAGGQNPAKELEQGQFRHQIVPNKKKGSAKKDRQEKPSVKDVHEGVLGMNTMPSLGRLQALSGIEAPVTETNEEDNAPDESTLTVSERRELVKDFRNMITTLDEWVDKAPAELDILNDNIDWLEKTVADIRKGKL